MLMNVGMHDVQGDHNYRYKMERMSTKIEGRGNGIKTVLTNVVVVAEKLRTSPEYVTKYLGTECGAASIWNKKRMVGIVNGVHQPEDLQEYLYGFLDFFILCPSCKLPELQHKFKSSKVGAKCFGCGWKGKLSSSHKVMKYIYKHPMKTAKGKPPVKPTPTVMEGTDKKDLKTPEGEFESENWYLDKDKRAMEQERKIAAAIQEKMKANLSNENPDTPVALLKFILDKPNPVLVDIVSEFQRIRLAHKLENAELKLAKVLVDAVFDFSSYDKVIESIDKHKDFLSYYTHDKTCSFFLISYLEEAIVENRFLDETPFLLEKCYDCDVFTESFLVEWHARAPEDSYVLQDRDDVIDVKLHAKPFINWCASTLDSRE